MTNEENFAEYVRKNGEEILLDDARVKGLIGDFFSSDTAFKNVLIASVQAGVVKKLRALKKNGVSDIEFEIAKITRVFTQENSIMESAAKSAVDCFAAILFDKKRRREDAGQKPGEAEAITDTFGNKINQSELIFNTSLKKLKFSASRFWQAIYARNKAMKKRTALIVVFCVLIVIGISAFRRFLPAGARKFASAAEVKTAVAGGYKINTANKEGWTSLAFAVSEQNIGVMKALIAYGADVDRLVEITGLGEHPILSLACTFGEKPNTDAIKILLDAGANANIPAANGVMPLHAAIISKSEEAVSLLLERGADVNAMAPNGKTPLFISLDDEIRNIKVIEALVKGGADLNALSPDGKWRPLIVASTFDDPAVALLLIENGADVNAESGIGDTPLMRAIDYNNEKMMDALIKNGADVNYVSKNGEFGWTPLIAAVSFSENADKIINFLLGKGAKINGKNKSGMTALIVACLSYEPERNTITPDTIAMLLKKKADPNIRDDSGLTAFDYAGENEFLRGTDALKQLEKATKK
jgi:ankyrin repeat protein